MPIDTGEWLDSPRVNTLSYDVRGIWLTLLCYMWDSPTRGIMAHSNGKPYTKEQILRELQIDPISLEILIESGLLAIDNNGAYHSPEMVRKERISSVRRNAGRKGGEITKGKVFAVIQEITPNQQASVVVEPPPESKQATPIPQLFNNEEIPEMPPELTPEQKAKAEKKRKYKYAENVSLTRDEYAKLCEEHTEPAVKRMIEILDNYKGQNGKRYRSDYRAILNWVVNRYNDEQLRYGTRPPTITTTAKPAGGIGAFAPNATRAVQITTGTSPQSGDAPAKDYSERF